MERQHACCPMTDHTRCRTTNLFGLGMVTCNCTQSTNSNSGTKQRSGKARNASGMQRKRNQNISKHRRQANGPAAATAITHRSACVPIRAMVVCGALLGAGAALSAGTAPATRQTAPPATAPAAAPVPAPTRRGTEGSSACAPPHSPADAQAGLPPLSCGRVAHKCHPAGEPA